ncbi:MAG: 50S ribosomal protein L37ae [Candidatus Aenigmarchaeota archaeon]|nr:50S ribosomal protein L37ae [Candidatus Aenigmarchaeota archaeon]
MKTKKVGSAGRFGSRYGKNLRTNFRKVEDQKTGGWECPSCLKKTLKREAAGIWKCKSCGYKFAGKAYKPS